MSKLIFDQGDHSTPSDKVEGEIMKQTAFTTPVASSSNTQGISRKYTKNLSELFVHGEDLQIDPIFHPFPKFPPELRLKVWKNTILAIPPRVICLQPISNDGIPAVLQACRESRQEAKKTFTIVKSGQPKLPFTLFINFENDTIYLNRNFKDKAKECFSSTVQTASHFYQDAMKEVRLLAMNLGNMHHLTTAYRDHGGERDLWQMLHKNCLKLKSVLVIIDGPQKERTVTKFRSLYKISNCNQVEFTRRHPKLVSVMESIVKAKSKGICKKVMICVVSIDQTKNLPTRNGEKEKNDGYGVYDSYGIGSCPMRWKRKAKPPTGAGLGQ
ncbi:hypothetical protein N431DRAFT_466557 [Stipitochalara longipes BDJ]|nr:hypothetical protein N431DRAFT_466557 [Stipitochalara longipes BDJ]